MTKAFLNQIAEACEFHGVTSGSIRGQQRGNQIALVFQGPFSPACRQQLRNLWDGPPDHAEEDAAAGVSWVDPIARILQITRSVRPVQSALPGSSTQSVRLEGVTLRERR
jgi:hypothetical protein